MDWFRADQSAGTVYAAVSGRMGGPLARANTTYPYITFRVISSSPDWAVGVNFEKCRIQFTVHTQNDADGMDAELIASKLRNRFDWANLTFDGSEYTTFSMMPVVSAGLMPLEDDRSQYVQDYMYTVQQSA